MSVPAPSYCAVPLLLAALLALAGCAATPPEEDSAAPSPRKAPAHTTHIVQCTPLPAVEGSCQVIPGSSGALALLGQVLAPEGVYRGGGVLIGTDGKITAVGCDVADQALSQGATQIICPTGVISPGLINAHDHLTYDWNAPGQWGQERYERRNQWRKGSPEHPPLSPTPLAAKSSEQWAWAEVRQVLSGTTSIAGSGGNPGFLRNLDKADLLEGLTGDIAYYSTFPLGDAQDVTPHEEDCNYPRIDNPDAALAHQSYLPHVGEGIDAAAHNEIRCLNQQGLITAKGAYVHAVAADGADGDRLAQAHAAVIWSPRSNLSLYGNTAPVTRYSRLGITVALATDWTPSGSMNLLRELKCADSFNRKNLGRFYADDQLWRMVTANPADALHLGEQIGRLKPGLQGDVAIYLAKDGATDPYRTVINANVEDVALVLRGGKPLYGDSPLFAQVPGWNTGCEALPGGVNGADKSLCVERELKESFAALQAHNPQSYPLFFPGVPDREPSCLPFRPAVAGKETGYSGQPSATDRDGDGIPDDQDNCPAIFNPIRPMDKGVQADCNHNGMGDACDPTPCP